MHTNFKYDDPWLVYDKAQLPKEYQQPLEDTLVNQMIEEYIINDSTRKLTCADHEFIDQLNKDLNYYIMWANPNTIKGKFWAIHASINHPAIHLTKAQLTKCIDDFISSNKKYRESNCRKENLIMRLVVEEVSPQNKRNHFHIFIIWNVYLQKEYMTEWWLYLKHNIAKESNYHYGKAQLKECVPGSAWDPKTKRYTFSPLLDVFDMEPFD